MKKLGIIGTGMIAEKHLASIAKEPGLEVSWVSNRGEAKLERIQEKFAVPQATTDYRVLLAAADVDAVLICTPPHMHKEMFIEAIRAGKHVFIEKPAAMSLSEIDDMIRVKNEHPGRIVCDCSARHSRLQPKYRLVKEIIDSGVLGNIYYVHHNSLWRNGRPGIEYHPEAKWFLNKAQAGGGPLFDWGVYDLSFHLGVLGDAYDLDTVNEVMLKSGLDHFDPGEDIYDVEEMFVASLQLTGGVRYYWERGNHANMDIPNETRIYGTRAGLKFGFCSWDAPLVHLYDYDENGKSRHTEIPVDMEGHSDDDALIRHFADLLEGKDTPAMPLELARKHLEIIFRCYEVAGHGV
jgi:predicted dehydrogenase